MSITDKRLTEIQARVDAATDGPWTLTHDGAHMSGSSYKIRQAGVPGIRLSVFEYGDTSAPNGELVANAPTDLSDLLAEVHRLRARLAKTQEVTAEKVEKAARALHADTCCNGDATGCQYPEDMTTEIWAAQVVMGTVQGGGGNA